MASGHGTHGTGRGSGRSGSSTTFYGRGANRTPRSASARMILESLELQNERDGQLDPEEATSGYLPGDLLQDRPQIEFPEDSEDEFPEDLDSPLPLNDHRASSQMVSRETWVDLPTWHCCLPHTRSKPLTLFFAIYGFGWNCHQCACVHDVCVTS